LRDELGFTGLVVADDLAMGAIAREVGLPAALERGLDAGVELFLLGNHAEHATQRAIDAIADGVAAGRIDAAKVRRAAEHVRAVKRRLAAPR
jgi:beta-N-acetylhexosaminidase